MLSTQYRLRLESICQKIVDGKTVELSEMIWAEKLAKANRSAATLLRQAMDDFLNQLDIGGLGNERHGISGFNSVDDIVDFFKKDNPDDWRQRD
jgi:hypothetical protein